MTPPQSSLAPTRNPATPWRATAVPAFSAALLVLAPLSTAAEERPFDCHVKTECTETGQCQNIDSLLKVIATDDADAAFSDTPAQTSRILILDASQRIEAFVGPYNMFHLWSPDQDAIHLMNMTRSGAFVWTTVYAQSSGDTPSRARFGTCTEAQQ